MDDMSKVVDLVMAHPEVGIELFRRKLAEKLLDGTATTELIHLTAVVCRQLEEREQGQAVEAVEELLGG